MAALMVIWVGCAASGLQLGAGQPLASISAGDLAVSQVRAVTEGAADQQKFDAAVQVDHFRGAANRDLLTGLRGKDVVVAFVESYGRVAVEGAASAGVQKVLDAGTRRLDAAGFSSRSAFLTSPTFGGLSWLAHSTLQSGLWVDNQRRYDGLLSGTRMTLTRAFQRAAWRTVAFLPSDEQPWPEGRNFYRYDKVYDRGDLGYAGPPFGFSSMPDQFVLSAVHRLELTKRKRTPVMAEIDLATSHTPWAPLPRFVDWNSLGDGTIFNSIHDQAETARELWRHPSDVKGGYLTSIAYTMRSLISYVEKYGDDKLVLILLGDHQPATVVTGHGASHDVPITIIARDPAVMAGISGWGWQDGLRPDSRAPVWPMDTFRDRLFEAYSPRLQVGAARAATATQP